MPRLAPVPGPKRLPGLYIRWSLGHNPRTGSPMRPGAYDRIGAREESDHDGGGEPCPARVRRARRRWAQADRSSPRSTGPGPKLSKHVKPKLLKASVTCSQGIRNAKKEPVLLFPATGVDSQHNFSWNYEPLYDDLGIPWCASDQPGDLSTNHGRRLIIRSYYVAYAIRHVHKLAGRKIAVQGHSQGGMIMRIGLRWWPDTRKMVDDVIGMAGTNHGTDHAAASCQPGCTPAAGQQASNSNFTARAQLRSADVQGDQLHRDLHERSTRS